jgi:hypothetical protein
MVKRILLCVFIVLCVYSTFGQDKEFDQEQFIRARTEVDAVVELGRLFYNMVQWTAANPKYGLNRDQMEILYPMCKRIGVIKRWDPDEAADYLEFMMNDFLTEDQLEQNDLFRIKWDERQRLQLRLQQGPGQGRGRIQMMKWMKGGEFNPMLSNIMDIGLAFQQLYKEICEVLDKEFVIIELSDDKKMLDEEGFDYEQRPGYQESNEGDQ